MSSKSQNDYFDTTHLDGEIGKRTASGGKMLAITQVIKAVAEIAATVILVRLLLPEEFGIVGMVASVVGFFAMFKDLGFSMATIQRAEITHEQVSMIFWINVGFSTLIMLMTMATAPALVWFFKEPKLLWVTIGLAAGFLFGGLAIQHEALLRRQMRISAIAVIQCIAMVVSVLVAVLLAWAGWSYWALVARPIVWAVINMSGVWLMCSWRPGLWRRGSANIRSLLGFGGNLTTFNLVNYFSRNLDDILIGRFYGSAAVGVYQKAYELFMIPLTLINAPVGVVAIPALSRLVGKDKEYREAYLAILEKILMIAMPIVALLVGASDWLVLVILGDKWTAVAPIIMALSGAIFAQVVSDSVSWLFISQDRTREMMLWGVISTGLAVTSFLVGLPWGALGVAAAYSLMDFFIRTPFLLWYIGRRGPVSAGDVYRLWLPFFVMGLAVLGALRLIRYAFADIDAVMGLGLSVLVMFVVAVIGLSMTRIGRRALKTAWRSIGKKRPA